MNEKKVHMIGIGGIGMSGLAHLLLAKGFSITGSDLKENELTNKLEELGVKVYEGHNESNIDLSISLVIRSAAIPDNNVEIAKAKSQGIEILKYSQMLGQLMREKIGIAISGSHGKTTTTGMIAYIFTRAGLEPSFLCGGVIPQLNGNASYGKGHHFTAEACEYDRSFLNLVYKIAIITNIDEDHLDYYKKGIEEINSAFKDFASSVGNEGLVIGNLDNEHSAEILRAFKGKKETYSTENEADWQARNITIKDSIWNFEVLKYSKPYGVFSLEIPGLHNVSNALATIAVANYVGIGREIIQLALSEFKGVGRRFEILGKKNDVIVIDDYAHHPTEIRTTLKAVKEKFPDRKIWCVFQPHQYARTKIFLKEFAKSFQDAHLVILPDIYFARDREEDVKKVSSNDLAKLLDENGKASLYLPTFREVTSFLKDKIEPNSILITLGAGDVGEIAKQFLE